MLQKIEPHGSSPQGDEERNASRLEGVDSAAVQPESPSTQTFSNQEGCPAFRTMIGGQALLEGIMMRGPKKQAIVVRKPDGDTEVKVEELKLVKDRHPVLGIPFLRGCVSFLDSMVKGVKALMWSAEFYPEEEDETPSEPSKFDQWLEKKLGNEKAMSVVITLSVVLGIAFSIGLFILLPTALTSGVLYFFPGTPLWVQNVLEGVAKVVIFTAYLMLCSHLKEIKRTFSYHGAEHKTIFCYERRLPLTVENVRNMPRHHPRCGTSFLFVVIIVSILASSVVFALPAIRAIATNVFVRMGMHLILLPIVVGVTYEINRWVGRHDNAFTRIIAAPGLWMQNWTTFEPDDSMIEVAIEALELVLPDKAGEDAW